MEAFRQLSDHSFNQASSIVQCFNQRSRSCLFHICPQRSMKCHTGQSELLPHCIITKISFISKYMRFRIFLLLEQHFTFINICRSYFAIQDDSMLVYQQVSLQAIIKHRFGGTISIGGIPFKETAEIRSAEVANRHGKTICDTNLTTGWKKTLTQIFPNLLLQFPEICRLPQKGGSSSKLWKQRIQ